MSLASYRYPAELIDIIEGFSNLAKAVFSQRKLGVLLVGSASRGEFCWSNEGELKFYSDIEFIVAAAHASRQEISRFDEGVAALQNRKYYGERFKIDYCVQSWSQVENQERKIFIFDAKSRGIDLADSPIAPELPLVTRQNIDQRELNEVLLHRVKSLVTEAPQGFFDDNIASGQLVDLNLSIAKNSLDVTTWLHPYESKELTSGFAQRLQDWRLNFRQRRISEFLTDADLDFLNQCLEMRTHPERPGSPRENMRQCLALMSNAIAYCKAMNGMSHRDDHIRQAESMRLFREYMPRRRAMEIVNLLRHYRHFGAVPACRAALLPRKGRQINFGLHLLRAAIADGERATDELAAAEAELANLRKVEKVSNEASAAKWQRLKDLYLAINPVYI
jgi:hypothetical protein